jgi:hypothetical protein
LEELMNLTQLASLRRRCGQPISRRHFVRSATSALAAGAALTSGVWTPLASASEPEHEHDAANPVPIPIGSFGFHVNAPGFPGNDPVDADPSTITDFQGFTGLAYISGMVSRTDRRTHAKVDSHFCFPTCDSWMANIGASTAVFAGARSGSYELTSTRTPVWRSNSMT